MARTGISRHGRTEGYVLLDAIVAVLLSALIASAVSPCLGAAAKLSAAGLDRARAFVAEENARVMERLGAIAK